ncbi:peroxide stress protein YaaA [Kribbella albertanoniae]|uniref:Peroxide stress protein YaaA n=1 Tax=Kribbella albertanoniae TaxID=1266829 RepID=A0A4R4QD94_9ACTN|nr:peroxide stress protein YaaA [Kribbella albertanoniae]TDC33062.1 peroxide stress protein YaaA [Kribbella albertanoniae]
MTLILLPPSEGKTGRTRGRAVDFGTLSFPELNPVREQVLETLAKVSASEDAYGVLGVGASLQAEVDRNTRWRTEPAVPVSELYSGVLYDALGYSTLSAGTKRRAANRLLVVSAAWGALRPADRVPPYRLSMGTTLPGHGPLAGVWREPLAAALAEADGVIVDCRSSTYVAAWRPSGDRAAKWVSVNVVRERDGVRTVVSHMAKHTRGLVARHILESGKDPGTPKALHKLVSARWTAELEPAASGWTLTVVERD